MSSTTPTPTTSPSGAPRHPGVRDGGRGAVLPGVRGPPAAGEDVRAACILTVSDTLSEEETSEGTYLALEDLEKATDRMIEVALEAGSVDRGEHADGRRSPIPIGVNLTTIGVPSALVAASRRCASRRPASARSGRWDHFVSRGQLDRSGAGVLDDAAAAAAATTDAARRQLRQQRHEPSSGGARADGGDRRGPVRRARVELGIGIGGHPGRARGVRHRRFPSRRSARRGWRRRSR